MSQSHSVNLTYQLPQGGVSRRQGRSASEMAVIRARMDRLVDLLDGLQNARGSDELWIELYTLRELLNE